MAEPIPHAVPAEHLADALRGRQLDLTSTLDLLLQDGMIVRSEAE